MTQCVLYYKIYLKKQKGESNMPKKAKEMERIILKDGWYLVSQEGSHRQYKHPIKKGKVTIPFHTKELTKFTECSIYKQAGIERS